jgi:3-phytase
MKPSCAIFATGTQAILMAACTSGPDVPIIAESYVTVADEAMNIDSVATHAAIGNTTWLFATAKEGHVVRIYDAASGEHLRDLGGRGSGPGEFQRPNGILARDGLLIVVERDNRRVQVFNLPGLAPLAIFGQNDLVKPYGAYLQPLGNDNYRLFVSDAYETADERVPPPAELDHRIHVFELSVERDADETAITVSAQHTQAFGATAGDGILFVVESLFGDPVYDRLLIAEEDPAGGRVIKTYSLDGRYTGPLIGDGVFQAEPEGIALFACDDGSGYWIATDQAYRRNIFHLFDRATFAHVGGFAGAVTEHTDGIWLNQAPIPGFPAGALFAVHDDQAVSAFDWRAIAAALALPQADCS